MKKNFLTKLGEWSYTKRWAVLITWLVILGGLGAGAAYYMQPMSSAISIPGTEAQKTFDHYSDLFPDQGGASGRIVFSVKDGDSLAKHKAAIDELTHKLADVDTVSMAVSPFENPAGVSKDGTIGYTMVQLEGAAGSVDQDATDKIDELTREAATDTLSINLGGDIIQKMPEDIVGVGEIGGVVLALVVLLMTLGSLIAAGMPILVAIMTVGLSTAGMFSLSELIDINSTTPALAIMLGLAVGIDYSLFIINRYRTYLLEGHGYLDAVGRAISTSGRAVLFAAATVIIALSALAIVNIPFLSTMGITAAATVAIAALLAISLLPALLGFAGPRIFGKKSRELVAAAQKRGVKHTEHAPHKSGWYKWGKFVTSHPWSVILACVVVVGIIAIPATDMKLGLPSDETAAKDSTERKAYDLLAKGFGDGYNGPLLVLAEDMPKTSTADKEAVKTKMLAEMQKQVSATEAKAKADMQAKMAQLSTPQEFAAFQQQAAKMQADGEKQKQAALKQIDEQVAQYAPLVQYQAVADRIAKLDGVAEAMPATTTKDGTIGVLQVIPKSGPSDDATKDLVRELRKSSVQREVLGKDDATMGVTGSTAMFIDINQKLSDALPVYLAVVVGLSFLILIVAFRSILVPIKATLGFLLSVAAMFGALVAVFQWGWFGITDAPGPIVSFIPIIAIGILFGLAMDYEFFLVSGMHEAHQHTKDAHKAVLRGFFQGARVVVAAGTIMVLVFAGFISNGDATIQSIGFALAVGILVDAFIVRMTIVPAVMALLGNSAWWLPKWIDRILPHVDMEGNGK